MVTNKRTDSIRDTAQHTSASPQGNSSKPGTRRRVLTALACPPALVAISGCHTVLAATYWVAFLMTNNGLYISVAVSYSVVTLISWFKVREIYKRIDGAIPATGGTQSDQTPPQLKGVGLVVGKSAEAFPSEVSGSEQSTNPRATGQNVINA